MGIQNTANQSAKEISDPLTFDTLVSSIPSWLVITDLNQKIVSIHNDHLLPSSLERQHLVGRGFKLMFAPRAFSRVDHAFDSLLAGEDRSFFFFDRVSGGISKKERVSLSRNGDQVIIQADQSCADCTTIVENAALLHELVHRVKNNFQVLDSIIALHGTTHCDPNAQELCASLRRRVFNLSIVHEFMSSHGNFDELNLHDYLMKIMANVISSFSTGSDLSFVTAPRNIMVDTECASKAGAILNELITNSIKYGFLQNAASIASFWIDRYNDEIHIYYFDDGPYYQQFSAKKAGPKLGSTIIDSFTDSLGGLFETVTIDLDGQNSPSHLKDHEIKDRFTEIWCHRLSFACKECPQ